MKEGQSGASTLHKPPLEAWWDPAAHSGPSPAVFSSFPIGVSFITVTKCHQPQFTAQAVASLCCTSWSPGGAGNHVSQRPQPGPLCLAMASSREVRDVPREVSVLQGPLPHPAQGSVGHPWEERQAQRSGRAAQCPEAAGRWQQPP